MVLVCRDTPFYKLKIQTSGEKNIEEQRKLTNWAAFSSSMCVYLYLQPRTLIHHLYLMDIMVDMRYYLFWFISSLCVLLGTCAALPSKRDPTGSFEVSSKWNRFPSRWWHGWKSVWGTQIWFRCLQWYRQPGCGFEAQKACFRGLRWISIPTSV